MTDINESSGPYEIQEPGESIPPALWGDVAVRESADDLLDLISAELLIEAQTRIRLQKEFHFALAWTKTIAQFMERMMYDPGIRQFPWARTHCWLLNDTQQDDCYLRLQDILVPHSGIDEANVHGADSRAEGQTFDYVLLDVGPDGRVGTVGEHAPENEVLVPQERVNQSEFVALVAMGSDVQTLLHALDAPSNKSLPIQSVRSESGTTRWYLSKTTPDEEAEPFAG
jgi:hypothetical protein